MDPQINRMNQKSDKFHDLVKQLNAEALIALNAAIVEEFSRRQGLGKTLMMYRSLVNAIEVHERGGKTSLLIRPH